MKKQINDIKNEFENCSINDIKNLINLYIDDDRCGVQKLIQKAEKKLLTYDKEIKRLNNMLKFENIAYQKGKKRVAGFDEVGRGCLAGPVVTVGVILPKDLVIFGVNDSKKVPKNKRKELAEQIKSKAIEITINMEDNDIIDKINILEATKLSITKNINDFIQKPDFLIIDSLNIQTNIEAYSMPKADLLSHSVAAASIVAKVYRDNYIEKMSEIYPQYKFEKNKGYGTPEHIEALKKYGACPIHRKSFIKNLGLTL